MKVSALEAEDRRFESCHPDCKLLSSNGQDVALSRRKYEFDSHREHLDAEGVV
jgi:hypothetical protein